MYRARVDHVAQISREVRPSIPHAAIVETMPLDPKERAAPLGVEGVETGAVEEAEVLDADEPALEFVEEAAVTALEVGAGVAVNTGVRIKMESSYRDTHCRLV